MMDVTVNIPEVVAEVRALFERYEQALIDKNVDQARNIEGAKAAGLHTHFFEADGLASLRARLDPWTPLLNMIRATLEP